MKIASFVVAVVVGLTLSACGEVEGTSGGSDYQPSDSGGLGMTYNGKQGIDLGGGLVMPFDGSGVQPGFGY